MTTITDQVALQLDRAGYAIIPGLMSQRTVAEAKADLAPRLDAADRGTGFDGARTKRSPAPFSSTPVKAPRSCTSTRASTRCPATATS